MEKGEKRGGKEKEKEKKGKEKEKKGKKKEKEIYIPKTFNIVP